MTTLFIVAGAVWMVTSVAAFAIARRLCDARCGLLGVTCLLLAGLSLWGAVGTGPSYVTPVGAIHVLVSVMALLSILVLHGCLRQRLSRDAAQMAGNELASAVLDTAGALVVVLDELGVIVRFNRACEALTGFHPDEVIGGTVWDMLLEDGDVEPVKGVFRKLRSGQFPNQHENYWVKKDGGRCLIAWSNTCILDERGAVRFVIGTGVDVTEKRQAEQALRESEERFSRAFHGNPLSVVIATLQDGVILDANQAFLDQSGFERDDVIGQQTTALGMWDDPGQRDLFMRKLEAEGAVRDASARFRNRRGELWLASIWMEIIEVQGRRCVLGIAEDVTERRRAEEALRTSEAKYHTLFDTSRDGIVYVSLDGHITDANPAYLHLTGYDLDDLRYLQYQDLTPRRWHEMEADIIRNQVLVRGYSEDYEKEYLTKDGTTVPISVRAWLIRDEAGNPVSMWARVLDISEQRRLEQERARLEKHLRHSQKMEAIGTLSAGVAHDFNNLLMAIMGYVDVAASCAGHHSTELAEALAGVRQAAQQATQITKSMLTFSRKATLTRVPTSLSKLVENATGMLEHLMGRKVSVSAQCDADDDVWIEADPSQIQQVLMNLAINARDAMPEGGWLEIALRRAERHAADLPANVPKFQSGTAVLTIRDSGDGMDESVRSRVFEPFFTTKPRGQGTGLGLSVVHGIVAEHRGYVDIRSAPGKGTTVVIAFPCIESSSAPKSSAADATPGRGEIVLVVEADVSVRAVLTSALRHAGYRVVGASDCKEARACLDKNVDTVRAVVADAELPDRDAFECIAEVRRRGLTAAVILTAGSAVVPPETVQSLGADLLQKPFTLSEVVTLVARRIHALSYHADA